MGNKHWSQVPEGHVAVVRGLTGLPRVFLVIVFLFVSVCFGK